MRTLTGVLILWLGINTVHANEIDLLSTKEEARSFLSVQLRKNGLIAMIDCPAYIIKPEFRHHYAAYPDTFMVEDPVTGALVRNIVMHDSGTYYRPADTTIYLPEYSYSRMAGLMDINPWHFYKADIDGNGLTDLVIDIENAGLFVVMDYGINCKGYMLSDIPDFSSYSFRDFISLPDGATALLLKRNPCTIRENFLMGKKHEVMYVTDTTATNTNIKVDTIFKIITTVDSVRERISGTSRFKYVAQVNRDTIDMRRRNIIDTVIYKFNGFVKYNSHIKPVGITKVFYSFIKSTGMGDDGRNCIEINSDGSCFMRWQDDKVLSATVDSQKLHELWNLISYSDVNSLSSYNGWIDHATGCGMAVYFTDGTVKAFSVWGVKPSLALGLLCLRVTEISTRLHWQPSVTEADFDCRDYFKNETIDERTGQATDCDW